MAALPSSRQQTPVMTDTTTPTSSEWTVITRKPRTRRAPATAPPPKTAAELSVESQEDRAKASDEQKQRIADLISSHVIVFTDMIQNPEFLAECLTDAAKSRDSKELFRASLPGTADVDHTYIYAYPTDLDADRKQNGVPFATLLQGRRRPDGSNDLSVLPEGQGLAEHLTKAIQADDTITQNLGKNVEVICRFQKPRHLVLVVIWNRKAYDQRTKLHRQKQQRQHQVAYSDYMQTQAPPKQPTRPRRRDRD